MAISASSQKYKDGNSNYNLKVSAATVARLKKGTKASNIAAANMPGASAEYKEAVRRFYGKGSVKGISQPNKYNVPPVTDKPLRGPKIDNSNPKPTQAQMDAAKKKKAANLASAITSTRAEQKKPTAAQMNAAKKRSAANRIAAINSTRSEQKKPKPTDRSKLKTASSRPMGSKIKTLQRKGM